MRSPEELRSMFRVVLLGVLVLTIAMPAVAQSQRQRGVEADIEITYTSTAGTRTVLGRYFRSKDGRVREDTPLASTILDRRRGTITLLNHGLKEARVIAVPSGSRPLPSQPQASRMRRPVEHSVVEGQRVTKSHSARGTGETDELWVAENLGLVMFSKVDSAGFGMTRELKRLTLREPNPSVFEIPKDYTVVFEAQETARQESARGSAPRR